MHCNICESVEWVDFAGRKNVSCARCGSLERTRILFKHLQRLGLPKPGSRVLHFAPERGLANVLRTACGDQYHPVDYFEDGYSASGDQYHPVDYFEDGYSASGVAHFNMCVHTAELKDESYDLIIHNHVLERIMCDVTSVVLHLQRALAKDGYHLFSIPVRPDRRYEEFRGDLSVEEATRRFGQRDHCRNFGVADLGTTFGLILDVDFTSFAPGNFYTDQELDEINFPNTEIARRGINPETIFVLKKSDCLFTR